MKIMSTQPDGPFFNDFPESLSRDEQFAARDLFEETVSDAMLAHLDLTKAGGDLDEMVLARDGILLQAVVAQEEFVEDYLGITVGSFHQGAIWQGGVSMLWESGKRRREAVSYTNVRAYGVVVRQDYPLDAISVIKRRIAEIRSYLPPVADPSSQTDAIAHQIHDEARYIPVLQDAAQGGAKRIVGLPEMEWVAAAVRSGYPHPRRYGLPAPSAIIHLRDNDTDRE